MNLEFYKYQGTGNDFVIIDNRQNVFNKTKNQLIAKLCDRRFGVGADGLLLLENSESQDFKMIYYNADGNESTMCGNGGRCIVAFANYLKIIENKCVFDAIDGLHKATINNHLVNLQMKNVMEVNLFKNHVFLDTGSPHHVTFCDSVEFIDVFKEGKKIRNGKPYFKIGTNVNFVEQINQNTYKVRTYERGVEDETLSCGTGVTAVAIAVHKTERTNANCIHLETMGGNLEVNFKVKNNNYTNIFLKGPAMQVFKGIIKL